MGINDILGAGKVLPMDKLADMISGVFGRVTKSYFYKKDADAKAYEIRALANAYADAAKTMAPVIKDTAKLTGGLEYKDDRLTIASIQNSSSGIPNMDSTDTSLIQRAVARSEYKEALKQLNVESVTAFAAEQLKEEETVTDEPVDSDWASRFFNIVEDVSNEEMQELWGRILAGEIRQPKTFSLRTLEMLKNFSKEDAEAFTKLADYAISRHGISFVFKGEGEDFIEKFLPYPIFSRLLEAGALNAGEYLRYNIEKSATPIHALFKMGDIGIAAERNETSPQVAFPIFLYSNSGKELLTLVTPKPSKEYIEYFGAFLKKDSLSVKYGEMYDIIGESVKLRNAQVL